MATPSSGPVCMARAARGFLSSASAITCHPLRVSRARGMITMPGLSLGAQHAGRGQELVNTAISRQSLWPTVNSEGLRWSPSAGLGTMFSQGLEWESRRLAIIAFFLPSPLSASWAPKGVDSCQEMVIRVRVLS